MKIVIDIPDRIYKITQNRRLNLIDGKIVEDAIKNGTPLPKGHGKIVDVDKLIDSRCNECGHIRGVTCTIPCYEVRRMLSDAPTIIEADTAETEE